MKKSTISPWIRGTVSMFLESVGVGILFGFFISAIEPIKDIKMFWLLNILALLLLIFIIVNTAYRFCKRTYSNFERNLLMANISIMLSIGSFIYIVGLLTFFPVLSVSFITLVSAIILFLQNKSID
ncbi:MAG: hypothetical protein HGA61_05335 [Candidatus Moranbacteria bacterium]|nr:hypothetical protein [Candidatus Moranbacteria bacterium]